MGSEWPRDDAPHFVRSAQNVARGLTNLVQLPEGDDVFVGGDLKDAVGRGVDDRRPGPDVLLAEFRDDLRARRGLITERRAAGPAFELRHHVGREAVGVQREWLIEMDADHLPVTGSGVFARRGERTASMGHRRGNGRDAVERADIAESECGEVRHVEAAQAGDIAESVGAGRVVELRGIGHGARADAIEDDPNDAGETQIRG